MPNEDARSLPGAAQAALRKRAVQAVLDGMSQAEAARVFGLHPNAVNRWVKRHRQGGLQALSERRRGRRAGEQAALSPGQEQEVIALVRDTTPDQLGMPGFLWTRDAVAELIAQRCGVCRAPSKWCDVRFMRMPGRGWRVAGPGHDRYVVALRRGQPRGWEMMDRQARRSGLVMGLDTYMIAGNRACSTSTRLTHPIITNQTSPHFAKALRPARRYPGPSGGHVVRVRGARHCA